MTLVTALQMASSHDVDENFQTIEQGLVQAKQAGSQLLVTPEESLTLGMTDKQKLALSKESESIKQRFSELCQEHQMWLIVGSVPIQYDTTHYSSTCLVYNAEGELKAHYQKIHMFDVQVESGVSFKESDFVHPGKDICIVKTPVGVIGLSICYDLRFPDQYQQMTKLGAQIIVIPSAFTPQTGRAHWEILLRARAVENLCYVIAPNQCGLRPNGQGTYGHSCIVHPWGHVMASKEDLPGVMHAEVDLSELAQIRAEFPVLDHQRV